MISSKIYLTLLICIISSQLYFAQNHTQLKIDELLKESKQLIGKDDLRALILSEKATKIAEKTIDSKRKAFCYLNTSNCLVNMSLNKESLNYMEKGLRESATKNDLILYSQFIEIKALNYFTLDLLNQAIENYKSILSFPLDNSSEAVKIKIRCCTMLASIYLYSNKYIKAKYYINIAQELKNQHSSTEIPEIYIIIGYIYLDQGKKDSALIYFKKSSEKINRIKDISNYSQLRAFGDFYYYSKDYKKSLKYYFDLLEDMKRHRVCDDDYISNTYKRISDIFRKLNDKNNELLYLDKYLKQIQKIESRRKENIQAVSKILSEEKKVERKNQKSRLIWILTIVPSIIIIIIIFFKIKIISLKRTKYIQSMKHSLEIQSKEKIIIKQKETKKNLEKKINELFPEIIQLAKTNNPEFFARFNEIYPEVITGVLKQNPKLRISELTLCAYIFLGFNTKDIASILSRSISTVANRKYNLRKKLHISPEINFEIWIKNLTNFP
ncbi:hypothetical protein AAEU33_20375 [Chryseobacterium sp. Chry.R1]|uniref:helix-turn-helix transcriptional regulator n=1 Tax=Chryseobacterium sp. Chry.R1 TaxID=3139392 RepID=UPI0031F8366A